MCQSKAQGGQRCYKDTCPIYINSIKKGNVDKAKDTGRGLILTPNSIENFRNNGEKLIKYNKETIYTSKENVYVLEELEKKINILENNTHTAKSEAEMDAKLTVLQARLEETAKKQENEEPFADSSEVYYGTNEEDIGFRNNPDTLMQRVDMPEEHEQILKEKDVDEFFIKRIAETTKDNNIRRKALGRYAKLNNITFKQAAENIPENIELKNANYETLLNKQQKIKKKD